MKKILILTVAVLATLTFIACGSSSSGGNGGEGNNGPRCGDGKVDDGEVCDGNIACADAGHFYPEFEAVCNSDCTALDTTNCKPRDPNDKCGNGTIDAGEICEQGQLKDCSELSASTPVGQSRCRRDCRGWTPEDCSSGGKIRTCAQTVECILKCSDESCINACKEAATEQGAALLAALESCASACGGLADSNCLSSSCYDEYYACFPLEKCGNGKIDEGEICEEKETKPCQELSTEDKTWQPINDAVCNKTCDGWDTYSCIDINALTCYQAFECVQACSDSECEQNCLSKTSVPAKTKYDTMKACLDEHCSGSALSEECINEHCKFQTDACKTHLTCGNGNIDQYEICEAKEFVDCGEIKDSAGESLYEAGTAQAFCNSNCTEWSALMCYKFCSCAEVKTCIEQECGGYPTSNAENTDEKKACISKCEDEGNHVGKKEAQDYRTAIESCVETDQSGNPTGNNAWDSDTCKEQMPSQAGVTCGTEDNAKCPY